MSDQFKDELEELVDQWKERGGKLMNAQSESAWNTGFERWQAAKELEEAIKSYEYRQENEVDV